MRFGSNTAGRSTAAVRASAADATLGTWTCEAPTQDSASKNAVVYCTSREVLELRTDGRLREIEPATCLADVPEPAEDS
jgi:hypothetical protein